MSFHAEPPVRLSRSVSREESLRLLRDVDLGRIVFISRAVPAIRLVSHIVNDDQIIIGTEYDVDIANVLRRPGLTQVIYQADLIDQETHLGWSITVTGRAGLIEDEGELEQLKPALRGWPGQEFDLLAQIRPERISGLVIGAAR